MYIVSILTYTGPAWNTLIAKHWWKQLEVAQVRKKHRYQKYLEHTNDSGDDYKPFSQYVSQDIIIYIFAPLKPQIINTGRTIEKKSTV